MGAEGMIRVPEGWVAHGALPSFDPSKRLVLLLEDLHCLTEDLWQVQSPGERLILDLGWYPAQDPTGSFRAVMVLGREWMKPIEAVNTPSLETAQNWLKDKIRPFLR